MTFDEKCNNFWAAYHQFKDLRLKDRIGYVYGGIEPGHSFNSRSPDTVENVLEHTCGAIELVWLLRKLFPDILESKRSWDRMFDIMLHHDIGESVTGDSADDGTRNEVAKNVTELVLLQKYLSNIDHAECATIMLYFEEMQHPDESHFGAIGWMIDKLEALLMLAWYESHNIKPTLEQKTYHSTRDNFYIDITHDCSNLAVWTAHFLDYAKNYQSFEIFVGILKAAVISVRNSWFEWTNQILSTSTRLYEH